MPCEADLDQPMHPPSLTSLRCLREETVDHKIPFERMKRKPYQTGRILRLIFILAGAVILLVLPDGSFHHCTLSYLLSECSGGHDQNARKLRITLLRMASFSWFCHDVAQFIKTEGPALSCRGTRTK